MSDFNNELTQAVIIFFSTICQHLFARTKAPAFLPTAPLYLKWFPRDCSARFSTAVHQTRFSTRSMIRKCMFQNHAVRFGVKPSVNRADTYHLELAAAQSFDVRNYFTGLQLCSNNTLNLV